MDSKITGTKSGYLKKDFQLFHLKDKKQQTFQFHYHEFDKIIIFLSGKVTYLIEGKAYFLKPWDILLVNHCDIHKAIIDPSIPYERIIIWSDPEFLRKHNYEGCDLSSCFNASQKRQVNLIRMDNNMQHYLKYILSGLEDSLTSEAFGSRLLSNSLFVQFLIHLNRIFIEEKTLSIDDSLKYDKQIEKILNYINSNLSMPLSVESICSKFFISRYYLMHKFKAETGYTLHNYIVQKRLFAAVDLIKNGTSITKAAETCGFNDYSTFLKAFKKTFKSLPTEFIKE